MKRHTPLDLLRKEDKMKGYIRVLLVDDYELARDGLRLMLESEEDIEVVGDCASAEEAFSQVGKLSPDLVLMDIQMPGMDGIEATRRLKKNGMDCDADVIMLAECADYLIEALEAGATGYCIKGTQHTELAQSIREVYWNEHSLERDVFVEGIVELAICPPADATQVMRFTRQLETTLDARILQTVSSWDWGTVISVQLKLISLTNLLDELGNMPDVEKVVEGPSAREGFSNLLRRFRTLTSSKASLRKRIVITLKEERACLHLSPFKSVRGEACLTARGTGLQS